MGRRLPPTPEQDIALQAVREARRRVERAERLRAARTLGLLAAIRAARAVRCSYPVIGEAADLSHPHVMRMLAEPESEGA